MGPQLVLHGRDQERAAVLDLLERARQGHGSALAVTGGPGSGKTALLRFAREHAQGFRVLETGGVAAESTLPLAGVHRLCPMDRYTDVHRLLVEQAPVLVLVDDASLLDRQSSDALAFAARRIAEHSVVMLFSRERDHDDGLPVLRLSPLDDDAAVRVLTDHSPLGVSRDFADEAIDLAGGNPLALVELAASPTPGQLPPDSALRTRLRTRFKVLTEDSRLLVLLAVVDEDLELDTVARAGLDPEEARDAGLLVIEGDRVSMPTALLRSTLHAEAPVARKRQAHALLADVLDPDEHRSRWLWHRAKSGRETDLAGLAAAAEEARRTGDYATSSQAFQRAATLARSPKAKARHLIAAASDHWSIGRTRQSQAVLRQARTLTRDPELRGLADLVRGGIELGDEVPGIAARNLLKASDELLRSHRGLAITALVFAAEASSIAGDHVHHAAVAARAAQLRVPDEPPATQLMFDHLAGMAATLAGRHDEAFPALSRVVGMAGVLDDPRSKIWGSQAAYVIGNGTKSLELATHAVGSARERGITSLVPWALVYRSLAAMLLDQHSIALDSSLEGVRSATAMGQPNAVVDHLTVLGLLSALQGNKATALHRLQLAAGDVARRGLGRPNTLGSWAFACVDLVDDRPVDALNRLRLMAVGAGGVHPGVKVMTAPHYVEAAVGCGQQDKARKVLERFESWASSSGSPARLALVHRSHALLAGADADEHFREAIRLHRASGTAMELAKTELFYGHRLRRDRQPRAAREHLRDALKIFQQYESEHFVQRVRAELRASGDTVTPARRAPTAELTPQQAQIAQLVVRGATNREIAAQLFLSHRTVEHHLRNTFAKLEVRSRVELARLLG
jgi:DNA-binding CsgD family transcriptional regulator